MMFSVLIAAAALAACSASFIDPSTIYTEGDRYIYFPDGKGELHLIDLEDNIDYNVINSTKRNPEDNEYRLYTRNNPTTPQVVVYGDGQSVLASNFDPSKGTVVAVHGWASDGDSNLNNIIREAFLDRAEYNVFILDWGRLASSNYVTAKNGVAAVGRALGQFLMFLTNFGASLDTMHLVGQSLGGHLVGCAGRETGGRVARISGLDPAGPLWIDDVDKIQPKDGKYVEIIHTNAGVYGLDQNLGHVDFWPNGGTNMPGCLINMCSHTMGYEYFAATVKYNHLIGRQCQTISEAKADTCSQAVLLHMGNDDFGKDGSGIFRVNTARSYPF